MLTQLRRYLQATMIFQILTLKIFFVHWHVDDPSLPKHYQEIDFSITEQKYPIEIQLSREEAYELGSLDLLIINFYWLSESLHKEIILKFLPNCCITVEE